MPTGGNGSVYSTGCVSVCVRRWCTVANFVPGRWTKYCDQRLSVCPLAYIKNHTRKFHEMLPVTVARTSSDDSASK